MMLQDYSAGGEARKVEEEEAKTEDKLVLFCILCYITFFPPSHEYPSVESSPSSVTTPCVRFLWIKWP